jgi:serine protease Do
VTFLNKKTYDSKVIGTDPKTELALIQIVGDDVKLPPAARLGNSDAMEVGDWVIAVGNPFGLGNTVTQGIISATGRVIGAGPYDDFLQTDAAINPGNSGGPLFNMDGEVIGINTAIVAQGQGIGFAIPINMAKQLLPQLKQGKVVRGWLGIAIQNVTPELQKFFDLKELQGVIVAQVLPDSPALAAGIQQGDVILTLNGEPIEDANSFSLRVSEIKPGNQAELGILRSGRRITKTVTVGEMPEEVGKPSESKVQEEQGTYGFTVQNLTGQIAESLGLGPNVTGVVVAEVQPGGAADNAGLQVGDVIQEVNRRRVTSVSDFRNIIQSQPKGRALLLLIRRGENSFYMVMEPKQQSQ